MRAFAVAALLLLVLAGQASPGPGPGGSPRQLDTLQGWVEGSSTPPSPSRPTPGAAPADGNGLPLVPRYAQEERSARLTAPCCAFAYGRGNASDFDGSGFYDRVNASARANGTTPANHSLRFRPVLDGERAPVPLATWYASANATAFDSRRADRFDHVDADARVRLTYENETLVDEGAALACRDHEALVPGPETCS